MRNRDRSHLNKAPDTPIAVTTLLPQHLTDSGESGSPVRASDKTQDSESAMASVFTIGYEGIDIDRFVATLKTAGVRLLADVRAVAISRKKGFSKNLLKSRLEEEGLVYLHFQALGDPKPGRLAARDGRFDDFREIYNTHFLTSEAQAALGQLADVSLHSPTCLMCFERDPKHCHRRIIASAMPIKKLHVIDLFGDLPRRYDNYPEKIQRHHIGQGLAAAE